MRSLLLRIFISYWIAAGLVIIVLNWAGPPMHRPEFSLALDTLLQTTGQTLANGYDNQHCPIGSDILTRQRTKFYLAATDGSLLCGAADIPGIPDLVARAISPKGRLARKFYFDHELYAMPVHSASGKPYVFVMEEPYAQKGFIFGILTPSYTTISISIVFTLLLAYMLTRPLRRLRYATQQIASGKLDTRVDWGNDLKSKIPSQHDEINGLIYDFNHMANRIQGLLSAQHLLLRDVSHELRSPLTRLQVALELACQNGNNGMTEHLDRIRREADRINDLVSELLSLSFMESMKTLSQPDVVSLSDLLTRLTQDAVYEARGTHLNVESSIRAECYVVGDPALIRRAVENIVRNAIRFTPEVGTICITLDADEKTDRAVIQVDDTGPGIPEEELDAIVKPFYIVDSSRNQGNRGCGLGLSIAARAIELHKGSMTFANRPRGGLSAYIYLPLTHLSVPAAG